MRESEIIGSLRINCEGVGGDSSGGDSRNFGGKGVEYNEQCGGKVWRFEAVGRNGGTGVDSSEQEFGLVGVSGNGFGGDVEMEERSRVDAEDRRDGGLKGKCCGGLQGSYCGGGESHIDMFLKSIIDKRCMNKSWTERLYPVVTLQ